MWGDCKGDESQGDSSQGIVEEGLLLLKGNHVSAEVSVDKGKREFKRRGTRLLGRWCIELAKE